MRVENTVCTVSNYATEYLNRILEIKGNVGYKLVSTEMAQNEYGIDVMYLFFTREADE